MNIKREIAACYFEHAAIGVYGALTDKADCGMRTQNVVVGIASAGQSFILLLDGFRAYRAQGR